MLRLSVNKFLSCSSSYEILEYINREGESREETSQVVDGEKEYTDILRKNRRRGDVNQLNLK